MDDLNQHPEKQNQAPASARVPDDVTPSVLQSTLDDAEHHCILHTDNQPPKKSRLQLLSFTDATWNTLQKATSNCEQKKRFLSSKFYGAIQTLPDKPSNAEGYHSICYKNFTAVTTEQEEKEDPTKKHLRSASEPPPGSTITAGIFPGQYLFCNQVRKGRRRAMNKNLGHVKPKKRKDASEKLLEC